MDERPFAHAAFDDRRTDLEEELTKNDSSSEQAIHKRIEKKKDCTEVRVNLRLTDEEVEKLELLGTSRSEAVRNIVQLALNKDDGNLPVPISEIPRADEKLDKMTALRLTQTEWRHLNVASGKIGVSCSNLVRAVMNAYLYSPKGPDEVPILLDTKTAFDIFRLCRLIELNVNQIGYALTEILKKVDKITWREALRVFDEAHANLKVLKEQSELMKEAIKLVQLCNFVYIKR